MFTPVKNVNGIVEDLQFFNLPYQRLIGSFKYNRRNGVCYIVKKDVLLAFLTCNRDDYRHTIRQNHRLTITGHSILHYPRKIRHDVAVASSGTGRDYRQYQQRYKQ